MRCEGHRPRNALRAFQIAEIPRESERNGVRIRGIAQVPRCCGVSPTWRNVEASWSGRGLCVLCNCPNCPTCPGYRTVRTVRTVLADGGPRGLGAVCSRKRCICGLVEDRGRQPAPCGLATAVRPAPHASCPSSSGIATVPSRVSRRAQNSPSHMSRESRERHRRNS